MSIGEKIGLCNILIISVLYVVEINLCFRKMNLCFNFFFLDFVGFFSRVILATKKSFFFVVLKKIPIFAKFFMHIEKKKDCFLRVVPYINNWIIVVYNIQG